MKPFAEGDLLARVRNLITVRQSREAERAKHEATEAANQKLQASSRQLYDLFQQAPGFMGVLRGPSHVVELANAAYYKLVGHRDMLGKPLLEALPEIKGQGLIEVLDRILVIAEPYVGTNVAVFLQRAPGARLEERLQRGYFDDHFSKCRESAKIEVLRSPRRIHESH